jgi:hypothetical protein
MFRAQNRRGELLQSGGRVLPHSGGETHLFRAESIKQLLLGPAGVARNLRQKTAGAIADDEVNPVGEQIEIERMCSGFQRGKYADLDLQLRKIGERYPIVGKARIAEHRGGRVLNDLCKGAVGIQPAYAAAKTVRLLFMQRHEASGGLQKGGVCLLQRSDRFPTQRFCDRLTSDVKKVIGLFGRQLHLSYLITAPRKFR